MFSGILFKNSFWAIFSSFFQNIIFSLFFIVVARVYIPETFSFYIIANTLYGVLLSFSTLGMGQWFIRANSEESNIELAQLFFNIQLISGGVFYFINVGLSYYLYTENSIHLLSIILGLNIVFDNLIYVFKSINIASFRQKQTFLIQSAEASLKFIFGIYVYQVKPDIFFVAIVLLLFRFLSYLLFHLKSKIKIRLHLFRLFQYTSLKDIVNTIYGNRFFLFIGTISVLFWSIGGLMVSKMMNIKDIAHYEISNKLFALAEIIPLMILATLFPVIAQRVKVLDRNNLLFFKHISYGCLLYGIVVYGFVVSYSREFIPFFFGEQYSHTHIFCSEMFLTMTLFPSVLYQANILIALKLEKTDMYLNLLSLLVNVVISFIGLYLTQSISAIAYSIFISFLLFHLSQEYLLYKKGFTNLIDILLGYVIIFGVVIVYPILTQYFSVYFIYPFLISVLFITLIPFVKKYFAKA